MPTNNAHKLETEPIGKLLTSYAVPAILGMLVMALYNIVDRMFIGQGVGSDAIAGLALTFPVMTITTAVGTLIGVGASTRISIVLGMKDKVWAEKILGNSLVLTVALSAVYVTCFVLYMDELLLLFGGSEATIPYAHEYLMYILPGMALTNLAYSFNGMMRSSGYPTKAMWTMAMGAVINVALDPLFIFTFDLGIKGASIASVISMAITAALVMHHFLTPKSYIRFRRHSFTLELRIIRNIISIGMAPFLMNITASLVNVLLNRQLQAYGGDIAIGSFGIANTYILLIIMIILGLCQGMQPIVGYNYGAQRADRVMDTYFLTATIAVFITTISTILAQLFPEAIARCFTTDEQLIASTVNCLHKMTWVFPLVGFQIVTTNLFQSVSMAKISIFLSLTRQVLFLIPMLMILPSMFGVNGVWHAFPASDFAATVTSVVIIYYYRQLFTSPR